MNLSLVEKHFGPRTLWVGLSERKAVTFSVSLTKSESLTLRETLWPTNSLRNTLAHELFESLNGLPKNFSTSLSMSLPESSWANMFLPFLYK